MKLFLIPASEENINRTIERSVNISVAERFLDQSKFNELKRLLADKEEFHCWAMTESREYLFDEIESGDIAIFTVKGTGEFNFIAEIFHKTVCEDLGKYLWSYVPNKPWNLIYFLKNIKKIDINKANLVSDLGYDKDYVVPGSIVVSKHKFNELLRKDKYKQIKDYIDSLKQ